MYRSEEDGEVQEAEYSHLHTGVPIETIVAHPDSQTATVTDAQSQTHTIDARTAKNAILTVYCDKLTLHCPDLHQGEWISDVVEVVSNP